MTPTLAPRMPKCQVCTLVASPMDVTIRLYDPDLNHLPFDGGLEYLRSVGLAGTKRMLMAKLLQHRRHVDHWLAKSAGAVAPAQIAEGVSRIERPLPTTWVDANQQGIDVGSAALTILGNGLETLEARELIAVAKIGQSAAGVRASLEMKGAIKRAEEISRLASGFDGG